MNPFLLPHGYLFSLINAYTLYFCRASEGSLLPLHPPPVKLSKSASSSLTPATSSQHLGNRGVKRGPPLPPRPKPGHPLYREYTVRPGKVVQHVNRDVQILGQHVEALTWLDGVCVCVLQSKIPQGNTKVNPPSSEPEESDLQVITSNTHKDHLRTVNISCVKAFCHVSAEREAPCS